MLAVSACVVSGCGSTCVDDGLVSQQNNCPGASGATTSNGPTLTDSASESDTAPTDSAASQSESNSEPTVGSMSDSMSATDTEAATDTAVTVTVSDSDTDGATDTNTDSTDTATDSDTDGGPGDYCVDADMDGFGDPAQCTPVGRGEEPPPGTVPNDDDCADGDGNTFPGAAENEDPEACMQDEDGDGWGDNMPDGPGVEPGTDCNDGDVNTFPGAAPNDDAMACMTDADGDDYGDDTPEGRGVDPGTDCDDAEVNTFPGSAENEVDPLGCTKDEDGDGWGSPSVPPGVDKGRDCVDTNANYNPEDRVLFTMVDNLLGVVSQIDIDSGVVSPLATLIPPVGAWQPYSAAVSPVDGKVYAHNSAANKTRLITFDYCAEGSTPEELASHGQSICGLAFDNNGVLYGIDSGENALVTFDTASGEIIDTKPLMIGDNNLQVVSCGMAYDCFGDRLLMTQGEGSLVYQIDPANGAVTELSNPMGGNWTSVGAEYDVVSEQMYIVNATTFIQATLDGSDQVTPLDNLSIATNDLTFGPVCP